MTLHDGVSQVETALAALRAAEQEREAAGHALADILKDAFPNEQERVRQADAAVAKYKGLLTEAIGMYGALPADARSPVGWAHYSSAARRVYAPVQQWREALLKAGLSQYITAILDETINPLSVATLIRLNPDFHKATEGLITEIPGKPVLRYGFAVEKPSGLSAELQRSKA